MKLKFVAVWVFPLIFFPEISAPFEIFIFYFPGKKRGQEWNFWTKMLHFEYVILGVQSY